MVNNEFSTVFDFFVDTLNTIQINNKLAKGVKIDSYGRIVDAIAFIYEKRAYFDENLTELKQELQAIEKDVDTVRDLIDFPSTRRATSLIRNLNYILNVEILDREARSQQITQEIEENDQDLIGNGSSERVAIFKSAIKDEVERQMNEFLSANNVDIINILQSSSDESTCITLLYRPSQG